MYCVMIFFDRVLKLHFHLLTVMLYLRIRGKGCLIYSFLSLIYSNPGTLILGNLLKMVTKRPIVHE